MALSSRVPSTAATNQFVPSFWANQVIDAAKTQLVNVDAVNATWLDGFAKGQIFYIPKKNTITATEVVVGTKGTALNPLNTTGVTVTMNQWYEAPFDLDYMTKAQSQVTDWDTEAAPECAYAVKVNMDLYVSALYSALNGSSVLGADGVAVTDDLLIQAMETLDESNAPRDGKRSLILDPSAIADMMKFDKFVAAMYVATGAVANGVIGQNHPIYGATVRVTNNLTAASVGNYCVMLHKNAIAVKAQMYDAWKKEFEELHETRWQAEILYGASEAQDAFGVPFYSRKS